MLPAVCSQDEAGCTPASLPGPARHQQNKRRLLAAVLHQPPSTLPWPADVQGARAIRSSGIAALFVFIAPPSLEELERRLRGRGTETPVSMTRRIKSARHEISRCAHTSGSTAQLFCRSAIRAALSAHPHPVRCSAHRDLSLPTRAKASLTLPALGTVFSAVLRLLLCRPPHTV